RLLRPLFVGHVLQCQENTVRRAIEADQLAGIQDNISLAFSSHLYCHAKRLDRHVLWQDTFKMAAQFGSIPLATCQRKEAFSEDVTVCSVEQLMKGPVGPDQLQITVKRQQRVAHRIHEILCKPLGKDGLS